MKNPKGAQCGTTGGHARHVRLKEPICEPCREANRLANQLWRAGMTRLCGCGRRILDGSVLCAKCGSEPAAPTEFDDWTAADYQTVPRGWNRGPNRVLIGSLKECNGYPCTEHDFCDQKEQVA